MNTTTTTTTSAPVYSIRDEVGRLLASGEYAPFVEDAAYNKACVLNPDRATTTFTYYANGEAYYSERKVCFKDRIRAGYPHHYTSIFRDERCIIDYTYYAWTDVHTIFDDEETAIDFIMERIANDYTAMHEDEDDETFEMYLEREWCYWAITPINEWRENARIARFGARSVVR